MGDFLGDFFLGDFRGDFFFPPTGALIGFLLPPVRAQPHMSIVDENKLDPIENPSEAEKNLRTKNDDFTFDRCSAADDVHRLSGRSAAAQLCLRAQLET